jgi:hypothetical protein
VHHPLKNLIYDSLIDEPPTEGFTFSVPSIENPIYDSVIGQSQLNFSKAVPPAPSFSQN